MGGLGIDTGGGGFSGSSAATGGESSSGSSSNGDFNISYGNQYKIPWYAWAAVGLVTAVVVYKVVA